MIDSTLPGQSADAKYGSMTIGQAARLAEDPKIRDLLMQLNRRVRLAEPEMAVFREWCDRADQLYYAEHFTAGGADLWWTDPSASTAGRSHVSVNTPPVYVDIPASLQAVEPIENMLATDTTEQARNAASAMERVYTAWKRREDWNLKFHKAATIKGLYGRTAARIVWDKDDESPHPEVQVVDQPQNLYLGWKTDAFDELEWVAYVMRMDPNAVTEKYGVNVTTLWDEQTQSYLPLVSPRDDPYASDAYMPTRDWLYFGNSQIEIWDYWYRVPVWSTRTGKLLRMATYNLVMCGNYVLQGPSEYKEYKGKIPYVPVFNTYVPGLPTGRPELYDMEQIIREQYELITKGSQMISNGVAGDFWQLVGENSPWRVPAGLKPKRNQLVGPGPGNRIEAITPFIAQFQLEQFLGRLDRSGAIISGLNDLMLGLVPAQALNSSKAVNAFIAQYETRLAMRRRLFYKFRREVWELALTVWQSKSSTVRQIIEAGGGDLDVVDPSLNPRDDMETAQRAINLMQNKGISQRTMMDWVGIDDPETEQDLIREESTDAALWPDRVMIMAQLMSALQSLNLPQPQGAVSQAQGQQASGTEALANSLRGAAPAQGPGAPGPGEGPMTPPVEGQAPGNAPGAPFAQASPQNGQQAVLQGMIQGGSVKGRIMTQQKLGRR